MKEHRNKAHCCGLNKLVNNNNKIRDQILLMMSLEESNLSVFTCTFSAFIKKAYLSIKFPCIFFIECKTTNSKTSITSKNQVKAENNVVHFNEELQPFTTQLVFDHNASLFLPKDCLILVNLVSKSRPDQVKLVGRVNLDLAKVMNDNMYEQFTEFKLNFCSVEGTLFLNFKFVKKQISHLAVHELDRSSFHHQNSSKVGNSSLIHGNYARHSNPSHHQSEEPNASFHNRSSQPLTVNNQQKLHRQLNHQTRSPSQSHLTKQNILNNHHDSNYLQPEKPNSLKTHHYQHSEILLRPIQNHDHQINPDIFKLPSILKQGPSKFSQSNFQSKISKLDPESEIKQLSKNNLIQNNKQEKSQNITFRNLKDSEEAEKQEKFEKAEIKYKISEDSVLKNNKQAIFSSILESKHQDQTNNIIKSSIFEVQNRSDNKSIIKNPDSIIQVLQENKESKKDLYEKQSQKRSNDNLSSKRSLKLDKRSGQEQDERSKELQSLKQENMRLGEQINRLKQQNTSLKQENINQTLKMLEYNEINNTLHGKCNSLDKDIEKLQRELILKEKKVQELLGCQLQQDQSFQKKLQQFQNQGDHHAQMATLENKVQELASINAKLQNQLIKQSKQYQNRHETENSENKHRFSEKVEEIQRKYQSKIISLQDSINSKTEALNQYINHLQKIIQEKDTLTKTKSILEIENTEVKQENRQLKNKVEEVTLNLNEKTECYSILQRKYQQIEQKYKELQNRGPENHIQENLNTDFIIRIVEEKEKDNQNVVELQETILSLNQEMEIIKQQKNDLKKELEISRKLLDEENIGKSIMEMEKIQNEKKILELHEKIKNIEEMLLSMDEQKQKQHEHEKQHHTLIISDLEQSLSKYDHENTILINLLEESKKHNELLTFQFNQAETKYLETIAHNKQTIGRLDHDLEEQITKNHQLSENIMKFMEKEQKMKQTFYVLEEESREIYRVVQEKQIAEEKNILLLNQKQQAIVFLDEALSKAQELKEQLVIEIQQKNRQILHIESQLSIKINSMEAQIQKNKHLLQQKDEELEMKSLEKDKVEKIFTEKHLTLLQETEKLQQEKEQMKEKIFQFTYQLELNEEYRKKIEKEISEEKKYIGQKQEEIRLIKIQNQKKNQEIQKLRTQMSNKQEILQISERKHQDQILNFEKKYENETLKLSEQILQIQIMNKMASEEIIKNELSFKASLQRLQVKLSQSEGLYSSLINEKQTFNLMEHRRQLQNKGNMIKQLQREKKLLEVETSKIKQLERSLKIKTIELNSLKYQNKVNINQNSQTKSTIEFNNQSNHNIHQQDHHNDQINELLALKEEEIAQLNQFKDRLFALEKQYINLQEIKNSLQVQLELLEEENFNVNATRNQRDILVEELKLNHQKINIQNHLLSTNIKELENSLTTIITEHQELLASKNQKTIQKISQKLPSQIQKMEASLLKKKENEINLMKQLLVDKQQALKRLQEQLENQKHRQYEDMLQLIDLQLKIKEKQDQKQPGEVSLKKSFHSIPDNHPKANPASKEDLAQTYLHLDQLLKQRKNNQQFYQLIKKVLERKQSNEDGKSDCIQERARFLSKQFQKLKAEMLKNESKSQHDKLRWMSLLKPCEGAVNELVKVSQSLNLNWSSFI